MPQPLIKEIGGIAYEGFKSVLDIIDRVSYKLPPLKAAASGLRSVLMIADVGPSDTQ